MSDLKRTWPGRWAADVVGYPDQGYSARVAHWDQGSRVEHAVGGTRDAGRALVEDVGVDHRGAHVVVAQQLLNAADIAAIFEEMGGEGMAQGVRSGPLSDISQVNGVSTDALGLAA